MSAIGSRVSGIEQAHAAGLIVGDADDRAILGDRAADAVAALDDALVDLPQQQIDFRQSAVAAEDVGIAAVAGEHRRGVGKVAQPVDAAERCPLGRVDDQDAAAGALDDEAEVAGAAQCCRWIIGRSWPTMGRPPATRQTASNSQGHLSGAAYHNPSFKRRTIQAASSRLISKLQGGIGVPGAPFRMISASASSGLSAQGCGQQRWTETALHGQPVAGAAILLHLIDKLGLPLRRRVVRQHAASAAHTAAPTTPRPPLRIASLTMAGPPCRRQRLIDLRYP